MIKLNLGDNNRKNIKIFFLDDCPKRQDKFRSNMVGVNISFANSSKEAISILEEDGPFVAIFLDHDLGGGPYLFTEDNNGMLVAEYIVKNSDKFKNTYIVVHSFNHPAGSNMTYKMEQAGLNAIYDAGAWARTRFDNGILIIRNRWDVL